MGRRSAGTGLALGAWLALSGCAAPKNVAVFAVATEGVAANAAAAMQLVNDAARARCLSGMATAFPSEPVDFGKLDSAGCSPVTAEDMDQRLAVIGSIEDYAAALKGLSLVDPSEGMDAASLALRSSLLDLHNRAGAVYDDNPVSREQLNTISQAVYMGGTLAARARQRKALRTIIAASDAAIQNTTAKLAEDFRPDGTMAKMTRRNLESVHQNMQDYFNGCPSLPAATGSEGAEAPAVVDGALCNRSQLSFDERLAYLQSTVEMGQRAAGSGQLFEEVSGALTHIGAVHAQLAEAVAQKDFSLDDEALRDALDELSGLASDLEGFRAQLGVEN